MIKVLIIGVNDVTRFIVPKLAGNPDLISELTIAAPDKKLCDDVKNSIEAPKVRITTVRMDINNEQATRMMLSISRPELVVNLLPGEHADKCMVLCTEIGAHYIAPKISAKSMMRMKDFTDKKLIGVVGCAFNPVLLASLILLPKKEGLLDDMESVSVIEVNMEHESDISTLKDYLSSPNYRTKTERVKYISEGKPIETEPLSVKINHTFPGVGKQTLYLRNNHIIDDLVFMLPDIKNVKYYSSYEMRSIDTIDTLQNLGLLSEEEVEVNGAKIRPVDFVSEVVKFDGIEANRITGISGAGVVIKGKLAGKAKRILLWTSEDNLVSFNKYDMPVSDLYDAYVLLAGILLICENRWNKIGINMASSYNPQLVVEKLKEEGFEYSTQEIRAFNEQVSIGD